MDDNGFDERGTPKSRMMSQLLLILLVKRQFLEQSCRGRVHDPGEMRGVKEKG